MSLGEVDRRERAAVERPQSVKICRIHLERGIRESRCEGEMGHGYQRTGAAASTSANVCSVKKNPQKTPKPQRLGSTVTIPYFRK